jgi:acyl carrier protein
MEAVSKYQATHLQAPNFAFKLTSRKFRAASYDKASLILSSVRHIVNAAEPVDEESIQAFESSFQPFGLGKVMFPTYGLAEHTVFVCSGGKQRLSVLKEELEMYGKIILADTHSNLVGGSVSKLVGCGFPAKQAVDVRIVDRETCKEMGVNKVGEIWIQSPSKALGYFRMESATNEDFHAKLKEQVNSDTDDGYLRTGDLGFFHRDELFICGRLKDLIIVGGRNYYPQDLEATTEATSNLLRPGCSAAFTIDPTKGGDEEVAVIVELRDFPTPKDIETVCLPLADQVFKSINQEHSLAIGQIAFLRAKTVPKTTSGKIARAWCRKGLLTGSLQIVYTKTFKTSMGESEIEDSSSKPQWSSDPLRPEQLKELRAMDRQSILTKLIADVANVTSLSPDLIDKETSIISILDSMSISQFSGLLESSYGVKISDHYLFNESTTLVKLVDVVKLGYAPDDECGDGANLAASNDGLQSEGKAKGLAGALGCPPGVVLCNIM